MALPIARFAVGDLASITARRATHNGCRVDGADLVLAQQAAVAKVVVLELSTVGVTRTVAEVLAPDTLPRNAGVGGCACVAVIALNTVGQRLQSTGTGLRIAGRCRAEGVL